MMQGISGMGSAGSMMSGANNMMGGSRSMMNSASSMVGGSRSMMNNTSSIQRNYDISGSENLTTKQMPKTDKNLGNIVDILI
jgi:hypothetical protein